jgi:hypothetical protein
MPFFRKLDHSWDNVEKCGGEREATHDVTTWRIRLACWISKATCTYAHAHTHKPVYPHSHTSLTAINYSSEIKFLGIHFKESLKWEADIRVLCSNLNKSLYMLQSLKYSTSSKLWRNMYFVNFHSNTRYGSFFWGNNGEGQSVFKLQNKAISLMSNVSRNISCREWFKRWNILTVHCVYIMEKKKHVMLKRL